MVTSKALEPSYLALLPVLPLSILVIMDSMDYFGGQEAPSYAYEDGFEGYHDACSCSRAWVGLSLVSTNG